jgi:Flp pilus assembly pilin Flp
MKALRRFLSGESGQDLVEWALLVALILIGSAGLMYNTGDTFGKVWTATGAALNGQPPQSQSPQTQPPAIPPPSEHHENR